MADGDALAALADGADLTHRTAGQQSGVVRLHRAVQRGWLRTTPGRPQRPTKLYQTWVDMRSRVGRHKNWLHVHICNEWHEFSVFRTWACEQLRAQPCASRQRLSIDREDSNGNYEPGNCSFIPLKDNARKALMRRWAIR